MASAGLASILEGSSPPGNVDCLPSLTASPSPARSSAAPAGAAAESSTCAASQPFINVVTQRPGCKCWGVGLIYLHHLQLHVLLTMPSATTRQPPGCQSQFRIGTLQSLQRRQTICHVRIAGWVVWLSLHSLVRLRSSQVSPHLTRSVHSQEGAGERTEQPLACPRHPCPAAAATRSSGAGPHTSSTAPSASSGCTARYRMTNRSPRLNSATLLQGRCGAAQEAADVRGLEDAASSTRRNMQVWPGRLGRAGAGFPRPAAPDTPCKGIPAWHMPCPAKIRLHTLTCRGPSPAPSHPPPPPPPASACHWGSPRLHAAPRAHPSSSTVTFPRSSSTRQKTWRSRLGAGTMSLPGCADACRTSELNASAPGGRGRAGR